MITSTSRSVFLPLVVVVLGLDIGHVAAVPAPEIRSIVENESLSSQQKVARLLSGTTSARLLFVQLKKLEIDLHAANPQDPSLAVLTDLLEAIEKPTPDKFQAGAMEDFYCFIINKPNALRPPEYKDAPDGLKNPRCDEKIDGYAYAAYWMSQATRCWKILDKMLLIKEIAFRASVQEYYEYHQGKNACVKPEPAARCQVGYCWGAEDEFGLVFRPAVEISGGTGTGLGFANKNSLGFTLNASIGARLFFMKDRIDIRGSIGVASIPLSDSEDGSQSALLLSPGIGFYNGIFGISGLFLLDFGGQERAGKGLGISVDLAAFKNVVGNK